MINGQLKSSKNKSFRNDQQNKNLLSICVHQSFNLFFMCILLLLFLSGILKIIIILLSIETTKGLYLKNVVSEIASFNILYTIYEKKEYMQSLNQILKINPIRYYEKM